MRKIPCSNKNTNSAPKRSFYFTSFSTLILSSFVLILLDQLVKIEFCSLNFLFSYCIINSGSAYGLFGHITNYTTIIAMLGMGISILILYYYKIFISEVGIIATSLFLGGIISNTIDRLLINGVRDMFSFFNTSLFGIFNLADIYLTFGSLIALYIIISPYATKFFITK